MKLKADKIKILNMTRMRELKDDKLDFITDPRYTEGIYRLGISDTRATGEVDGVHFLRSFQYVQHCPDDSKYIVFYSTPWEFVEDISFIQSGKVNNLMKKVWEDFKNSKCIFIYYGFDLGDVKLNEIKNFLKGEGVPLSNFIYIQFGFLGTFHKSWLLDNEDFTLLEYNDMWWYGFFNDIENIESLSKFMYKNQFNFKRPHKFITINNAVKNPRKDLLLFLIKHNLLNEGISSFFTIQSKDRNPPVDLPEELSASEVILKFDEETINRAIEIVPYSYDISNKFILDEFRRDQASLLNFSGYNSAYFEIIAETDETSFSRSHGEDWTDKPVYDYFPYTEKTGRAFLTGLPFILLTRPNSLEKLREIGFKTFEPFINESYDMETNNKKRLEMAFSEIKRIVKMDDDEIYKWFRDMRDITEHNLNYYFKFKKISEINIKSTIISKFEKNRWT
jgi:hypothetical protein